LEEDRLLPEVLVPRRPKRSTSVLFKIITSRPPGYGACAFGTKATSCAQFVRGKNGYTD